LKQFIRKHGREERRIKHELRNASV
jgi:hypothetical protein